MPILYIFVDNISENESKACRLEKGMAVRRFCARKRPEQGNLQIRRETSQIIWQGSQTGRDIVSKFCKFFSFGSEKHFAFLICFGFKINNCHEARSQYIF